MGSREMKCGSMTSEAWVEEVKESPVLPSRPHSLTDTPLPTLAVHHHSLLTVTSVSLIQFNQHVRKLWILLLLMTRCFYYAFWILRVSNLAFILHFWSRVKMSYVWPILLQTTSVKPRAPLFWLAFLQLWISRSTFAAHSHNSCPPSSFSFSSFLMIGMIKKTFSCSAWCWVDWTAPTDDENPAAEISEKKTVSRYSCLTGRSWMTKGRY